MSWYISESALIYLDNNATTPIDSRVKEIIIETLNYWANPSSNYLIGKNAKEKIEFARNQVAHMLKVSQQSVFFTSSASEANNWVIESSLRYFETIHGKDKKARIITSAIEHPSILKKLEDLKEIGKIDLTIIGIDFESGIVKLDEIDKTLCKNTCLVTIMLANNETGVIQPLARISDLIRKFNNRCNSKILIHSDVTQAIGKMKVELNDLKVDFISLSGHKFYGPRCGALVLRSENTTPLFAFLHGGGQERGMRGGTENTPMIAGLGKACEIVSNDFQLFEKKYREVRDWFEKKLKETFADKVIIHFEKSKRLPNTSSVAFSTYNGTATDLLSKCKSFVASTQSSCHSYSQRSSPILSACGINEELASRTVRFSFGRDSSIEDAEKVLNELKSIIFFSKFGSSLLNAIGKGPLPGF
ncbi:unnamed protein product [Dracunculus medinensis]|uniref:Selenocysteine lyase n=1 Tax=Dracunculus medinensis TaxID=318479 RepID=A0A0N4ULA8_DRAME|nr:unnamed protein product [Dracunculus medinensis]